MLLLTTVRNLTSTRQHQHYLIEVNVSLPITTVTVKPADEVMSIKQSPVLNGHLFLFQSWNISYELSLF
jgi:hypothetical protein